MSDKQIALYWNLWRRACAARGWRSTDTAFRHKVHRDLLGYDISHRHLSNPDFDYLKHAFLLWIDPTNLTAIMFLENAAANGERKRLLFSIGKLAPAAYRRRICVDLFDSTDLDKLTNEQLTLLRNTLHNRAHTKETRQRRAGQGEANRMQAAAPKPRQYTLRLSSR